MLLSLGVAILPGPALAAGAWAVGVWSAGPGRQQASSPGSSLFADAKLLAPTR